MSKIDKNVQPKQLSLTPRQVADAIGLSESSLKRWCDRGVIPSHRTVGGHRRLPVGGVLSFVRRNNYELRNPQILGLPGNLRRQPDSLAVMAERLKRHLTVGDGPTVRRIGLETFVAQESLAPLFDEMIGPAMVEVGHDWEAGELEIFRERRAVNIVLQLLHELRRLIEAPAEDAARAIGATLSGDHYEIATTMGELILAELGWNAQTIGANVPAATMIEAIDALEPRLIWLNVSHVADNEAFVADYNALYERAVHKSIAVAVGGPALTEELRSQIRATAFGSSMAELAELGRALLPRTDAA